MEGGLVLALALFVALPLVLVGLAVTLWASNLFVILSAIILFSLGVLIYPFFIPDVPGGAR